MNLANKQTNTLEREETGKVEIQKLEKEILELKGEMREEQMKAYRKLVSSSADRLVYFMRT